MKDSTFKIMVLALLLVVFTAVVITAKWADESDYDHISCPTGQVTSQGHSPGQQDNMRVETGRTRSQAESAVSWSDLNGYNVGKAQDQDSPGKQVTERLNEQPDDGSEPPDNSKYVYGDNNVE